MTTDQPGSPAAGTFEFRSRSVRALALSAGAIATLFLAGTAAFENADAVLVAKVAMGAGIWAALVPVMNVKVVASPAGIVVKNAFRTHFYRWDEIDQFSAGPGFYDLRAFGSPARLWLKNGAMRYVTAVQTELFVVRKKQKSDCPACRRLNEMKVVHREARSDRLP